MKMNNFGNINAHLRVLPGGRQESFPSMMRFTVYQQDSCILCVYLAYTECEIIRVLQCFMISCAFMCRNFIDAVKVFVTILVECQLDNKSQMKFRLLFLVGAQLEF